MTRSSETHERNLSSRGGALPAALFLTALLALLGAALHLAVGTEMQLAVNCLESDRVRFAAAAAVRQRSFRLRQALTRFRLPAGPSVVDVERYRDDLLSGDRDRRLSLLLAGVPGLLSDHGPWTLDLPLEDALLEPMDQWVLSRSACHLEPLGVSGSPEHGLFFTYRCRVTGEGRSRAPGRHGIAFCRQDLVFTITLARFPRSHWQLCLPLVGGQAGERRLSMPPRVFTGPVRTSGCPGFSGTGRPLSGLPGFASVFLTPMASSAVWTLDHEADPQFACGSACLSNPFPDLTPPGALARASLGLPPGSGSRLTVEDLRQALGLPAGTGRPAPGMYLVRNGGLTGGIYVEGDLSSLDVRFEPPEQLLVLQSASGPGPVEIRVDHSLQTTSVNGVEYAGLVNGPIFVEGSILDLGTGVGQGGPVPTVLGPDLGLTIAASGDITISGHLLYSASPDPMPDPRHLPPPDDRVLGILSAGSHADGSPSGGLGILLDGPAGRLRIDAAVAVGGSERGVRTVGETTVDLFGAVSMDRLVQPELFSWCSVTYDRRFAAPDFHPPCWPAGPDFEAFLTSWDPQRFEEISPYR